MAHSTAGSGMTWVGRAIRRLEDPALVTGRGRFTADLNAAHVLPDHSAPGDGSLVAAERDLISEIRKRALALKSQGVSPDDAGKQISADFQMQHPDWPNTNASGFVKSVYAEVP